ncbi:MAG: peptidoglycan editing factor PgeF [Burkholderiaceae bacterium]|nr:peptidoglycan editing factor PgeF [Burkholderiaceae bacterium]
MTPQRPPARNTLFGIEDVLVPRWEAPAHVRALSTTRRGGVSAGPWGLVDGSPGGWNLGARCGDDPAAVQANRERLAGSIGAMPTWLDQVHGTDVHVIADRAGASVDGPSAGASSARREPRADAAVTNTAGVVLAVLTADCLPVLLADSRGEVVAAAHAGWRGLADGVLERTVQAMRALGAGDSGLCAWLGPSIGREAFEVGDEVRERFCDIDPRAALAFAAGERSGKWLADLPALARLRLGEIGVHRVAGADRCTVRGATDFYSYRRDGRCGRMATLVWTTLR